MHGFIPAALSAVFQRARLTPVPIDPGQRLDTARDIHAFIQTSPDRLDPFQHFARHFATPELVLESLDDYERTRTKEIAIIRVGWRIACIVGLGYDHGRKTAEIAIYKHPDFKEKRRGITGLAKGGLMDKCDAVCAV